MKEIHYKINEIAKLFNIPVSTLHYWESIGLFSIKRNKENKYREYTKSDILTIWEIMLYRELEIPIAQVQEIMELDMGNMEQTYLENERKLEEERERLLIKQKKIQAQRKAIQAVNELRNDGIKEGEPDFFYCIEDNFQIETIKKSLENPYDCILYNPDSVGGELCRGIHINKKEEKYMWKKGKKGEKRYLEFLLYTNLEDINDNNLTAIRGKILEMGLETGEIIARYLLVATENGKRYEYYRAWIEVC